MKKTTYTEEERNIVLKAIAEQMAKQTADENIIIRKNQTILIKGLKEIIDILNQTKIIPLPKNAQMKKHSGKTLFKYGQEIAIYHITRNIIKIAKPMLKKIKL